MKKRLLCLFLLVVCLAMFPAMALAGSTDTLNLSIGDKRTLHAGSPSNGIAYAWAWTCSDDYAVMLTGDAGSPSCDIEVIGYSSSPVIVQCLIYTQRDVGGRIVFGQDYKDFRITISQPRYTVTLDANGGYVSPSSITVGYDETYGSLPTPTRSGYTFDGWYTSNGTLVTSNRKIVQNRDHTLYAEWTASSYTIYFNGNGSTSGSMSSMTCQRDTSYNLRSNSFSRTGYSFDGWNTRSSGTGTYYADRESVYNLASGGGSVTLYALWKSNAHRIPECAVSLSASSYTYNGSEKKPGVTVRDGRSVLTEGRDYTVSYRNNINAGTGYVTVTGAGSYSGQTELSFTILKASNTLTLALPEGFTAVPLGESVSLVTGGFGALSFSSGAPDILRVDETGTVTGLQEGKTTVTMTAAGDGNHVSASKSLSLSVVDTYDPSVCGLGLEWSLQGGTLTITGSGKLFDFPRTLISGDACNAPWYERRAEITAVVLSDGVTGIGSAAFDGCTGLTSVTIPNSVTKIGRGAFRGCTGLTSMTLPFVGYSRSADGYQGVFGYIFGYTTTSSSSSVSGAVYQFSSGSTYYHYYIPSSLRTVVVTDAAVIPDDAFYKCSMLTSVTISDGVTSIGISAFEGCTGLTSVMISDGVTSIGNYAFDGCTGLTSVTIPNSVTSIGSGAFYGCTGLTSIIFRGDMPSIGSMSFDDVTATVYYPQGNPSYTSAVMQNYGGTLTWTPYAPVPEPDGVLPAGLLRLEDEALFGCAFRYVRIPEGTVTIGQRAFADSPYLTHVYIPASVTEIAADAFENVSGLTILGASGSAAESFADAKGFAFLED